MTALSDKGLVQGKMGGAVDTWRQTVLLDPRLVVFHDGVVQLLQVPPQEFRWVKNFGCAVFPVGVDSTDLNIGRRERALAITTGFYFREDRETRDEAEAAIEDLEELWDFAVWSNEQLTWKVSFPALPPLSGATVNETLARRVVKQLPSLYADFEDDDGCGRIAEFTAVYPIPFATC